MAVTIALMVSA